jgi:WD40 repeat protein
MEQLFDPLKHDNCVVAVKFSPDGRLIATATWKRESVRIYDSSNGHLLANLPVQVNSFSNGALAWASHANLLLCALSHDGDIHCLDVSAEKTLAKWHIHSDNEPRCISLAWNDKV